MGDRVRYRMRGIQRAGRRIVAVALFGDRQRDDPGLRLDQPRPDRVALVPEKQDFAHAADDPSPRGAGTLFHRRIQPVLRHQPVAHVRRAQADPADAPVFALDRQSVVAENRGLRAVERAYSQVDDADPDPARIVFWRVDRRGRLSSVERSSRLTRPQSLRKNHGCRVGLLP
jgi:hypothetical protein